MKNLLLSLVLVASFAFAQENKVPFNGLITDLLGNPAKGAKIYVEKGFFSKSDKQGRFGLTNVHPTDTITVEYQKRKYHIPVEGRKSLVIKVGDQVDNQALFNAEEDQNLVDFGYGYVKRRESLDSSSGISGEVLRRTGATTILGAMKGLVPGVNITGDKVVIRGIGSVNSGTDPLFIVDGIETPSGIDHISIYDVKSVEVLKDGSMYGIRGANGVIIVKTVNGK